MPWVLSYFYHRQVPPASVQLLPPLLALPLYLNLKCYADGSKGGATQLLLPLVGFQAVCLLGRTVSTAAWYLLVALPPGRCGEHPGDLARGEEAAWVASPEYFHPGTLRSLFHFAKVETKGREAPAERREVSGSELRRGHSTLLMNEAVFAMHRFCVRCWSRSREWRGWSQLLRRSSQAEARHTDRHREEADRRNPSSSPVSGGQAGSKPCDFKTCFILGSEVRDQRQHGGLCHIGAHCLPPHSPLAARSCLHWHTFCIHRGLFGWWPHTPRMLLRDEVRHGARCNRKPGKGFSSLWGWEGRMLIPTRIQKAESSWHHKKKNPEKCPRYLWERMMLWPFLSQAHSSWVDTRSHVLESCPELVKIKTTYLKVGKR